jgi:hypothetical protein
MDDIISDSEPAMGAWETCPDHFFLYHYLDADAAASICVSSVSYDFDLDLDFY